MRHAGPRAYHTPLYPPPDTHEGRQYVGDVTCYLNLLLDNGDGERPVAVALERRKRALSQYVSIRQHTSAYVSRCS